MINAVDGRREAGKITLRASTKVQFEINKILNDLHDAVDADAP